MKNLSTIIIFSIYISLLNLPINAAQTVHCSPQLQKCLEVILKIPEAKNLIDAIRKEGSFHIVANSTTLSQQFGAFWDPDRRIIHIDFTDRSEGYIIGSLLFELHNASVNSKINKLNELAHQRKINKEDYVESMEYLEYINSINASKIANKGIKMGLLPSDAALPTYSSFKEHFLAQQRGGHSVYFSRNYDMCLMP